MITFGWNGQEFCRDHPVSASSFGFRFGYSFFETFRVLDGKIYELEGHQTLLRHNCQKARVPWKLAFSGIPEALLEQLKKRTGMLRQYISLVAPDQGSQCHWIFEDRLPHWEEQREKGLSLVLADAPYQAAFPGSKSGNYLFNFRAHQSARESGADECLLWNVEKNIISASMGNFLYSDGKNWFTPPVTDGARPGIIRALLLKAGLIQEKSCTVEDLSHLSAAILTNSWMGAVPVRQIKEISLPAPRLSVPILQFVDKNYG